VAKQLRLRPSELLKLDNEVEAWSFDRAVLTFGNALESKLQLIARGSKKQKEADRKVAAELAKWLNSADGSSTKGRFRDPVPKMK
jgi:hypothetical protein